MSKKYITLIKNLGIFAIGTFIVKLISFCLMPLYTSVLTTDQYAVSELLNNTVEIILPLATLSIVEALYRYSIDEDSNKSRLFMNTIYISGIGLAIVGIICVAVYFVTGYEYISDFFILFVTSVTYKITTQMARGIGQNKRYATYGIINALLLFSSNIILLVWMKGGIKAYLHSFSIGLGITALIAFIASEEYRYIELKKPDTKLLKEMLRFSIPNVPNMISWWINSVSDRYLILLISGTSQAGLYAAASKLPAVINMFSSIFQQAWQYSTAKEIDKENSNSFFEIIFKMYVLGCFLLCSFLVLTNKMLCNIMLKNGFYEAWRFLPVLILAATAGCISIYFGTFYGAQKDNKMAMISTMIGAGANIVLNLIFIPKQGAMGAAIATYLSYVVVMVVRMNDVINKTGLKINKLSFLVQFTGLSVVVFLSVFMSGAWSNLICGVFILALIITNIPIIKSMFRMIISKLV